jgi:hypothetical protein
LNIFLQIEASITNVVSALFESGWNRQDDSEHVLAWPQQKGKFLPEEKGGTFADTVRRWNLTHLFVLLTDLS